MTENKRGNPNWQKGKSGNPSGRPALPEEFRDLAKNNSIKALKIVISILKDSKADNKDKIRAAEMIIDRGYGKAVQQVDATDDLKEIIVSWLK